MKLCSTSIEIIFHLFLKMSFLIIIDLVSEVFNQKGFEMDSQKMTKWIVTVKPGETKVTRNGSRITNNNENCRISITIEEPVQNAPRNAEGTGYDNN